MKKVGIYGASGYTGAELAGILSGHPRVELAFATSEAHAGESLSTVIAGAPQISLQPAAGVALDAVELVFLCLPHSAAAPTAVAALQAGARVIDLSADFRLRDAAQYGNWYGSEHPAPELLSEAVYGLTETARAEDVLIMLASAGASKGAKMFSKCKAYHTVENGGKNKVGPNLWDIVGRAKASAGGFAYSGALKKMNGEWSYGNLDTFLAKPKDFVPGTKMVFAGLNKAGHRAAMLAYLRSLSDAPKALP